MDTNQRYKEPRKGEVKFLKALLEDSSQWVSNYHLTFVHRISPHTIQRHTQRLLERKFLEVTEEGCRNGSKKIRLTKPGVDFALQRITQAEAGKGFRLRSPSDKRAPDAKLLEVTLSTMNKLTTQELSEVATFLLQKQEEILLQSCTTAQTVLKIGFVRIKSNREDIEKLTELTVKIGERFNSLPNDKRGRLIEKFISDKRKREGLNA